MSILYILPAPIRESHQLQARDLLQTSIRWPRDDVDFLRAVINRSRLNPRECAKLASLRRDFEEAAHG
jgi:hypothetical protein